MAISDLASVVDLRSGAILPVLAAAHFAGTAQPISQTHRPRAVRPKPISVSSGRHFATLQLQLTSINRATLAPNRRAMLAVAVVRHTIPGLRRRRVSRGSRMATPIEQ